MSEDNDDFEHSLPASSASSQTTAIVRLDERLKWVVRSVREIGQNVDNLQEKVTKLVVYVSLGAFFGSAIVSVIVGVIIKWITT